LFSVQLLVSDCIDALRTFFFFFPMVSNQCRAKNAILSASSAISLMSEYL